MLISLDVLIKKYSIPTLGVIHIGAHQAEEADVYRDCGFKNVIWIEGNPELIPFLQNKLKNYSSQKVYQSLIDVEEKETVFNLTNDPQSSSIYKLKEHAQQYPSVTIEKEIICETQRLDTFLKIHSIPVGKFNFLNLDIQGNELNALKSLGAELEKFNFIYTEVQLTELYDKSHNLYELDTFLFSQSFKRAEIDLKYRSWGDALYIRINYNNDFSNFFRLTQSKLLVLTWPLRKKMYWVLDQTKYLIKNKLLKQNSL